jgi:argininosuccinate lyase
MDTTLLSIQVMTRVIEKLDIDSNAMKRGLTPEIFATDRVYKLVREGMSFREAYKKVAGTSVSGGRTQNADIPSPEEILASRTSTGTSGNLGLEKSRLRIGETRDWTTLQRKILWNSRKKLLGDR